MHSTSNSFTGAVVVPVKDIEEAIVNFSKRKEEEEKFMLEEFSDRVFYSSPPPKKFFGYEGTREELLLKSYKRDGETKLNKMFVGRKSLEESFPSSSRKLFSIYSLEADWRGDFRLWWKSIPEGLEGLCYPKATKAYLNPKQAEFVKEFK